MPSVDATQLAADLDVLALETWQKVYLGPVNRLGFREESITEHNLFWLSQQHPNLKIRKFGTSEERRNGADWEWWLGSPTDGWVGIRFQAKKLSNGRYLEIGYRAELEERIQCQVLVEEVRNQAQGRALFPFYCFYNGWDDASGWPAGVEWTIECSQPANCKNVPDVRVFGCAVAPAQEVLDVLTSHARPREASSYLPLQRPWSWLTRPTRRTVATSASEVLALLIALQSTQDLGNPELFGELPSYAASVREQWSLSDSLGVSAEAPTTFVVVTDLGTGNEDR